MLRIFSVQSESGKAMIWYQTKQKSHGQKYLGTPFRFAGKTDFDRHKNFVACLPEEGEAKSEEIANAMKNGVDAIKKYGGAKMGHRTMLDALEPASQAFYNSVKEGQFSHLSFFLFAISLISVYILYFFHSFSISILKSQISEPNSKNKRKIYFSMLAVKFFPSLERIMTDNQFIWDSVLFVNSFRRTCALTIVIDFRQPQSVSGSIKFLWKYEFRSWA